MNQAPTVPSRGLPQSSAISPSELARLGLARFVALDFETTGLDPKVSRIIELGAVRFEGGEPVARFSELVGVDEPLDPFITRLTGIRDEDLTDRPRIEALLPGFLDFLGSDPIVGQNVHFDLGFLEAERKRISKAHRPQWSPGPIHDTVPIARAFLPTLTSYGLGALARQLDVLLNRAHRAVHDAEATGNVLIELIKRARRTPFGELNEMSRILGGAAFTLGELIDGLSAIGPGDAGVDVPDNLRDNRIGEWAGENSLAPEPVENVDAFLADFLADDGPLSKQVPGFRKRDGQVRMAQEVYAVLKTGGFLMAEAGTGTGKSFAYLLPALMHARIDGGKTVVSTQTRHLQNQLFEKDLPALDAALGGGVRAVLLKGRGNYICKRRYEVLVADPERLEPAEREAVLPLVRWLNRTRTGDIGEVTGFRQGTVRGLWPKISSDSGYCSGRVCRAAQGCFLHRVRTSAQRAHVVLVNHALLFSDLSSGGGVLGEYDKVVFDEAHHIERVAADHLGISWNSGAERTLLLSLFDAGQNRGVLAGLRAYIPFLKTQLERGSAETNPLEQAIELVGEVIPGGDAVGKALDALAAAGESENGDYSRRQRYLSGEELLATSKEIVQAHRSHLEKLQKSLDKLAGEFEEAELDLVEGDDVLGEFRRLRGEVASLRENFNRLTGPGEENMVFWYEVPSNTRLGVRLQGAPLDIGRVLREQLYPNLTTAVFTSATLTVADRFDYLAGRLGIEDARGEIYPSPFDMRAQLMIAVAHFVGNPKLDPKGFTQGMSELVRKLPEDLNAGTLVLFTNQRMLHKVWDDAAPVLDRAGWLVLAQGISGAQAELLDRFRRERKSVLLGVDSFWEGIDVPGESLELSIIARLPFGVPTEPLVAARNEKIEREGGNPFMEYSLPEATLRLRQGLGRLIRTTEDVGVAVICDPRIVRSRWGRIIAGSLPVTLQQYDNYADLARDLRRFLRGGGR